MRLIHVSFLFIFNITNFILHNRKHFGGCGTCNKKLYVLEVHGNTFMLNTRSTVLHVFNMKVFPSISNNQNYNYK